MMIDGMGCDGPSKDYAYEIGEAAYNDILKLLQEKYHIHTDEKTLAFLKSQPAGFGYKDTIEAMDALKLAVQEMIWADHAASF